MKISKKSIAVLIVVAGLAQKRIPGEVPVIGKQIPADERDHREAKQQGYQSSEKLFHEISSISRKSHDIIRYQKEKVKRWL